MVPDDGGSNPAHSWQNSTAYAWTSHLSRSGFAWEILRRNDHYCQQWLYDHTAHGLVKDTSGATLVRLNRQVISLPWGLVGPLENPRADARDARVFWSPKLSTEILHVTSMPAQSDDEAFPDIASLECATSIYADKSDRQHVLFHDGVFTLQLVVTGTSILDRPKLAAEVITTNGSRIHHFRAIERLRDLQAHKHLRADFYKPARVSERYREILQTIDGMLHAASHRDIAVALFGGPRVDQDWKGQNRHMRDKVRKTIRRAQMLLDGDYQSLLR